MNKKIITVKIFIGNPIKRRGNIKNQTKPRYIEETIKMLYRLKADLNCFLISSFFDFIKSIITKPKKKGTKEFIKKSKEIFKLISPEGRNRDNEIKNLESPADHRSIIYIKKPINKVQSK